MNGIAQPNPLTLPAHKELADIILRLDVESHDINKQLAEFKKIVSSFMYPVLITTTDPHILYANESWERITGYTLKEVLGKKPKFLQSGKTPKRVYKNMWKMLEMKEPFTSDEFVNKRKDGSEYCIHTTIFPILKKDRVLFYMQTEEDITSRKQLEEMKQNFLSMAAHELKTPITTLKLLLQARMRHLSKGLDKKLYDMHIREMTMIDNELNRLTRIVDDILDVTRIERGKFRLNMQEVDLHEILSQVIKQVRFITQGHKVVYKGKKMQIIADPDRIKQVMINLLMNAMKYSPPKTKVEVTVEKKDSLATICVADQGMGISKNDLPHIFQKFYQSETNKNFGFGIGLYVAKEIVKAHKGKIWAKSKVGKGSKFYVSLRLKEYYDPEPKR